MSPVIWAQTNITQQQVQIPPLLFNALNEERFSTAYKRAFEPYWGLKWVSFGDGPSSPAEKKILKNGEIVYLYSTCRPHACDTEHLYFLYAPASGRGWGVLSIRSDVEGVPIPSSEVENLLLNSVGVKK
jgi:Inhibitor of vertebrate lysozyme (Ivy)